MSRTVIMVTTVYPIMATAWSLVGKPIGTIRTTVDGGIGIRIHITAMADGGIGTAPILLACTALRLPAGIIRPKARRGTPFLLSPLTRQWRRPRLQRQVS